ncbi:MAG: EAL domain-containing protein [Amphritea sp.]
MYKAEALIRWLHPSRGFISPAEFIPVAEETGLIIEIGNWVFRQAVRQVKSWRTAFNEGFQISVNKSPVQFRHEDHCLYEWFDFLHQQELPGNAVVVEMTEGLLMDSSATVSSKLFALSDAGIEVALDDFGTGYSSLSYLKKYAIDYLKIDQSFVNNLEHDAEGAALCESIIVMAHRLGIRVIAEGVETRAQCELLTAWGCDYAQGFWFSKPLPAEGFEGWLSNRRCELTESL